MRRARPSSLHGEEGLSFHRRMSLATADLCDAHPEVQVLSLPFREFGALRAFSGRVRTVRAPEDNSLVRTALEEPGEGSVLVVDGGGSMRVALLGDNLALLAVKNGWAGVIVYGCIRDSAAISGMALGVMALGTCPRKSEKKNAGERDVTVEVAGVRIHPGQFIYADPDGVIVAQHELLKG